MSSQMVWYTARSAGIVAWAVAAASVIWGLALSTRALVKRPRPAWLFDLHRFLGGLALVFTAVHVVAILADSYVPFGLVEVLVPFVGTWHPVAVAWGIVGLYVLLAVELTSLARTQSRRGSGVECTSGASPCTWCRRSTRSPPAPTAHLSRSSSPSLRPC